MKKLLASVAVARVVGYANTNSGGKLYIADTNVGNSDLLQADYEALNWVLIGGLGTIGQTGTTTNILVYDTWDTTVAQKAKGISDAGSPVIEVARNSADAGQTLLRAAALTNLNYAFKMVRNDATGIGGTGTIRYNRGLVSGPTNPNGKVEDFDLDTYTLGFQQKQVEVAPTDTGTTAPAVSVAPAITGTAQVGQVLTVSTGTWSGTPTYAYAWFRGGVRITGANASTYTAVTADIGKLLSARVTATNAGGSTSMFSAPTAAVIA